METQKNHTVRYRPVIFILSTFAITWFCAFWMNWQASVGYTAGRLANQIASFIESASPLLVALVLLWGHLRRGRNFIHYIFGRRQPVAHYLLAAFLFAYQFLHFLIFAPAGSVTITPAIFLIAWAGQTALGGGMEEGGWRGYLQPAFERRAPTWLATLLVAAFWSAWHIPYFILEGSMHSGGNFLIYFLQAVITAYTLVAIHKLTGSVLLCTFFHGWQNAIVMTIPADMGKIGFILMFLVQGILSVLICLRADSRKTHGKERLP